MATFSSSLQFAESCDRRQSTDTMDVVASQTDGHIQDFIRRRHEFFDAAQLVQFGACCTDRERYAIARETLERRRRAVPMGLIECAPEEQKSLERALDMKQRGNEYFKQSQWVEALKCYTLSAVQTPAQNGT